MRRKLTAYHDPQGYTYKKEWGSKDIRYRYRDALEKVAKHKAECPHVLAVDSTVSHTSMHEILLLITYYGTPAFTSLLSTEYILWED